MKSEELFDDLAAPGWDEPAGERCDLSRRGSALNSIVRALICFFAFALLGSLVLLILGESSAFRERHPFGLADFLTIDLLCGAGGLIILWVVSGCGFNPFRDARVESFERYVAESRRMLDCSELTIGAAQGVRAFLEILEQGARTLRRGGYDKPSVEALLKLQAECSLELRSVLNDVISPLPIGATAAPSTCSVRDAANTAKRLGAFLLTSRALTLTCEVESGIQSSRVDSRIACPIILAALREGIKSAEPRSAVHLSFKESGGFRNRMCVKLAWQARGFSGSDGVLAIDSLGLNSMLRPIHGSLAIQSLSGSRRVLEITLPLAVRTEKLKLQTAQPSTTDSQAA